MRSIDIGNLSAAQAPEGSLAMATIGGVSHTDAYARLENGRLLVECTLQPSGDQVVATLDTGGDECVDYQPPTYGTRVLLGYQGGGAPVILARLNDLDGPFPELSVPVSREGSVPLYVAKRTGDGQLLLLETGASADVLVRSGGSAQVLVDTGGQVLLSGRTHIGQGAAFAADAVGACVAPSGQTEPGEPAEPYEPAPATPAGGPIQPVTPPGSSIPVLVPATGIVRVKDPIESNTGVDPAFWAWLSGFVNVLTTWVPAPNDGGAALKAAMAAYVLSNPVPTRLASEHRGGSLCTASDT